MVVLFPVSDFKVELMLKDSLIPFRKLKGNNNTGVLLMPISNMTTIRTICADYEVEEVIMLGYKVPHRGREVKSLNLKTGASEVIGRLQSYTEKPPHWYLYCPDLKQWYYWE